MISPCPRVYEGGGQAKARSGGIFPELPQSPPLRVGDSPLLKAGAEVPFGHSTKLKRSKHDG